MDFGKLHDVRAVDFGLSDDDPRSVRRLLGPSRSRTQAFVGCPAWGGAASWWGTVYPAEAKSPDLLRHYASQFNAIELNTTYYRIPDETTVQRWISQVGPGFRFCPKFPQEITHDRGLSGEEVFEKTRRFVEGVKGLGTHLGPCLLQLGPGFTPTQLPVLAAFLNSLPADFRVAVEFRHAGWFQNRVLREDAWSVLEKRGVGTVITDVSGRRDVSHSSLTDSTVFVRFVGNSLLPSDFERIEAWAERLARWSRQGVGEIYFFVHQPGEESAPQTVNRLIEALNRECGLALQGWTPVPGKEQLTLF